MEFLGGALGVELLGGAAVYCCIQVAQISAALAAEVRAANTLSHRDDFVLGGMVPRFASVLCELTLRQAQGRLWAKK